jgi:hypothetical protein
VLISELGITGMLIFKIREAASSSNKIGEE